MFFMSSLIKNPGSKEIHPQVCFITNRALLESQVTTPLNFIPDVFIDSYLIHIVMVSVICLQVTTLSIISTQYLLRVSFRESIPLCCLPCGWLKFPRKIITSPKMFQFKMKYWSTSTACILVVGYMISDLQREICHI